MREENIRWLISILKTSGSKRAYVANGNYVADKIEFIEGKPWNMKSQQFIWPGEDYELVHHMQLKTQPEFRKFYVDHDTNTLVRIEQKSFKRITKTRK